MNNRFIGTTVAKKIKVNILNPNNQINLENKTISVYTGMIINGTNVSVPFGNFIIEKPQNKEAKENTSFTGYDYMIKFNIPYKNRVTFPCKVKVLFQDVCDQAGLVAGDVDFVNCDYLILGNPFTNNEDCRTVLSNIAQLAGGFAKIGRDNKVYIRTLKNVSILFKVKDLHVVKVKDLHVLPVNMLSSKKDNADEKLDGNNYFEDFDKNNMWGELNSLVLGLSNIEGENTALDDKASINKNGLTEIQINDNYFLIDKVEREKVIEPLWNKLKGLKYLPFKTEYYGYPYSDSGDMIYIEDTKDKGYVSYIFNHTFKFNGTYSGRIETEALTKVQTAYKNNIDIKTKFRNVERKVDKINGVIEDIIEEQTETSNKVSQAEQTINGFSNKVSSVEETVATIQKEAVTSVDVMYALSDSAIIAPENGWQTTAPVWTNGKFMWQKTITTYASGKTEQTSATCLSGAIGQTGQNGKDGTNGTNGQDGEKGDTGIGVKAIIEEYYLSDSNTEQMGGSWKATQDAWNDGKYIWTRNKITWTDDTTTYTVPTLATGLNTANEIASEASENANGAVYVANNASSTASNSATKAQQALEQANDTKSLLDDYKNSNEQVITELKKSVETSQTDSEYAIEIAQNIIENGVTKLDTKTGYTFNEDGFEVNKTGAETKSKLNEVGLTIIDNTGHTEESLLFAGYDKDLGETVVKSKNMTVEKYFSIGKNSRIEDFENGTAVFHIGGN